MTPLRWGEIPHPLTPSPQGEGEGANKLKMADSLYLSVVVPSYRSAGILERNLPLLLAYLQKQEYTWEVVVVDDGSNDLGATEAVCHKLGCIFCANEQNMGKGAAVRNGMKNREGFVQDFHRRRHSLRARRHRDHAALSRFQGIPAGDRRSQP